jgi:hypothetical protein
VRRVSEIARREGGMCGCEAGGRESAREASSSFCAGHELVIHAVHTPSDEESVRTKPAELNTAPLPALKIGLSEMGYGIFRSWIRHVPEGVSSYLP